MKVVDQNFSLWLINETIYSTYKNNGMYIALPMVYDVFNFLFSFISFVSLCATFKLGCTVEFFVSNFLVVLNGKEKKKKDKFPRSLCK